MILIIELCVSSFSSVQERNTIEKKIQIRYAYLITETMMRMMIANNDDEDRKRVSILI
jgi:hypothetical protein